MASPRKLCSVENCDRPVVAKRWCAAHYQRVKLTGELRPGDPIGHKPPPKVTARPYRCACASHSGAEAWHGTRHGFSYHYCRCEPCSIANRERDKARWAQRYGSKYGMSAEEVRDLLGAEKCQICGCTDPGERPWHIDHDHACCPGQRSCGKCVRGVLCYNCNFMIGSARDDTSVLSAAIEYLRAWEARGEAA